MKETPIPRFHLEWSRVAGISSPNQPGYDGLPGDVRSLADRVGEWARSLETTEAGLVHCPGRRWSIIAWAEPTRVRMIALKTGDYGQHFGADPFRVRDLASQEPGEISAPQPGSWLVPAQVAEHPRVATFQEWLKGDDSALLLGGAQALMDGARIHLDRGGDDSASAQSLWNMVPVAVRLERKLTIHDRLGIFAADLVVGKAELKGDFWSAERLGDYPEGRYEYGLQTAIDSGDEAAIHGYLGRRSPRQVMALAAMLLVGFLVIGFLMSW